MSKLSRYSFGVGDRFARSGRAQLIPFLELRKRGVNVTPVWNKSYREHTIIGSEVSEPRKEADAAVKECGWEGDYFVDADHINMNTVGGFRDSCDFFTIDVADSIGSSVSDDCVNKFIEKHKSLIGKHCVLDNVPDVNVTMELLKNVADNYLSAVSEARKIYDRIKQGKGEESFVVELSMDETSEPQKPAELLCILAAIADADIPVQTIAPRFSGRFNKGVDYVGDLGVFALEFEQNVGVIQFAIKHFGLLPELKLSVHSGSDKFAIYEIMRKTLVRTGAGVHVKTAGTTWLAELIGLAESGDEGADMVKDIYNQAQSRMIELCLPYADVLDINPVKLPLPSMVMEWDSDKLVRTLSHDLRCPDYNQTFRQLMHLAYKIAAEMDQRFLSALKEATPYSEKNVSENIYRHLSQLFKPDVD